MSSACSDFISSLGAATAANMRVLSYERPTYLLFPWELKDGAPESVFIWIPIMLRSPCPGTFSACLPGAWEAFSSTLINIRRLYVFSYRRLGPTAATEGPPSFVGQLAVRARHRRPRERAGTAASICAWNAPEMCLISGAVVRFRASLEASMGSAHSWKKQSGAGRAFPFTTILAGPNGAQSRSALNVWSRDALSICCPQPVSHR